MQELLNISPVDGRYQKLTKELSEYFSEYALIKYRVIVEIKWFLKLMPLIGIELTPEQIYDLRMITDEFNVTEALKVKEIENETKHDVKAVEYYLRNRFQAINLDKYDCFIHFGCTSEDINNLSYNLMIKEGLENVFIPGALNLINSVREKAIELRDVPMMSHTHGQPATPTTVGKELAIFVYRWQNIIDRLLRVKLRGKFSGATGNFSAHMIAYPSIDWINTSKSFVESLGQEYNPLTTQIESHDNMCLIFNYIKSFNNITYDFNSDMWLYISRNYFRQSVVNGEVGSSVMPHKVNPINHENSMANTRVANSIFNTLSENLPISRMQRDLSDSSMERNIGVGFAHSIISIRQSIIGFNKMVINKQELLRDLNENCVILAEAIQTVLRKHGYADAYEQLKELTRGKNITIEEIKTFVNRLEISIEDKKNLLELTPETYTGLASKLVDYI